MPMHEITLLEILFYIHTAFNRGFLENLFGFLFVLSSSTAEEFTFVNFKILFGSLELACKSVPAFALYLMSEMPSLP